MKEILEDEKAEEKEFWDKINNLNKEFQATDEIKMKQENVKNNIQVR